MESTTPKTIYTIRLHEVLRNGWKILQCRCYLGPFDQCSSKRLKVGTKVEAQQSLGIHHVPNAAGKMQLTRVTASPSLDITHYHGQAAYYHLKVGDILCCTMRTPASALGLGGLFSQHQQKWRAMTFNEQKKKRDTAMENGEEYYTLFFARPPDHQDEKEVEPEPTPEPVPSQDTISSVARAPTEASSKSLTPAKRKATPVAASNLIHPHANATATPDPSKTLGHALGELGLKKEHMDLLKDVRAEHSLFKTLKRDCQELSHELIQTTTGIVTPAEMIKVLDSIESPTIPEPVHEPRASNCDFTQYSKAVVKYMDDLHRRNLELSACLKVIRGLNQTLESNLADFRGLVEERRKDREALERATKEARDLVAALENARRAMKGAKERLAANQRATKHRIESAVSSLKPVT